MALFKTCRGLPKRLAKLSTCSYCYSSNSSSYVFGVSNTPLRNSTIGQLVQEAAEKYTNQICVVSMHQGLRKTYQEVQEDSEKLGAGLLTLGMKPGDRVGIWGTNTYEWYITQMGVAKAGLILVNINPAYQPNELHYCLNKVGVKTLISSERFKTQDYYAILNSIAPGLEESKPGSINSKEVQALKNLIMLSDKEHGGAFRFDDIFNSAGSSHHKELEDIGKRIQMDHPVNIQFTSGTTGHPKGATLSHHNIVNNGMFVGNRLGYGEKTHAICCSVPLYHAFGCGMANLPGLIYGAKVVMTAEHFNAEECLKGIEAEKCTSAYGTPTMYIDMLNVQSLRERPYNTETLETGIMAGAPCPQELCKQVVSDLNMKKFVVAYGQTETGPVTFQGFPNDSAELKTSTAGHILDHVEAKIVDEDDSIVPFGTRGEICTRGYTSMLGYWDEEDKTKETITPDRWFHTGDQGILHANGYVQIVGRIKDMVIRGGENIFPREIEDALHEHPELLEAQVVGVPDFRLGEELCAWVKLKEGSKLTVEDIRAFCKGKIAHFKIPKHILFVDEYPLTVTGKVQKFRIREESIKMLGLDK